MGDQDRKATPIESTRQYISASIVEARGLDKGREKSLVITKLEEALHWLKEVTYAPVETAKSDAPMADMAQEVPVETEDQPEATDKISKANAPATAK